MSVPFHSDKHQYVGGNQPRLDALDKVTGAAVYVHDIAIPGMLFGRVKTSPHAHALIKRIDVTRASKCPACARCS